MSSNDRVLRGDDSCTRGFRGDVSSLRGCRGEVSGTRGCLVLIPAARFERICFGETHMSGREDDRDAIYRVRER
jgi:hypothetical protein